MFYTWKEFSDWTDVTLFEVFLYLLALLISSFLLTIKLVSEVTNQWFTWWLALSPLFVTDALCAYFCMIVFIRQYNTGAFRGAFLRALFSFKRIFLIFLMKLLLCYRLEGTIQVSYLEMFLPLFYLLFLLIFRSFRL